MQNPHETIRRIVLNESPMPNKDRLDIGITAGLSSHEFGTGFVTAVNDAFELNSETKPSEQEINWIADATDAVLDRTFMMLREVERP